MSPGELALSAMHWLPSQHTVQQWRQICCIGLLNSDRRQSHWRRPQRMVFVDICGRLLQFAAGNRWTFCVVGMYGRFPIDFPIVKLVKPCCFLFEAADCISKSVKSARVFPWHAIRSTRKRWLRKICKWLFTDCRGQWLPQKHWVSALTMSSLWQTSCWRHWEDG